MSFDALTARLERLKKDNQIIAVLDAIRLIRLEVIEELDYTDLVKDEVIKDAIRALQLGGHPFQDADFLSRLNWDKGSAVTRKLLSELMSTGLRDGSLQALISDLNKDRNFAYHLCRASLDRDLQHIEFLASKYGIEPDLLRVIATTPLVPIFYRIERLLPPADRPILARDCPICGSSFNIGVYRGGFRFLLCFTCGHRVRVDFFFCPNCGNTEPEGLGFVKPEKEPALQVDYCTKCRSYIKTVNEDLIASDVTDPILLDLSTMDLDPIGRNAVQKPSR